MLIKIKDVPRTYGFGSNRRRLPAQPVAFRNAVQLQQKFDEGWTTQVRSSS